MSRIRFSSGMAGAAIVVIAVLAATGITWLGNTEEEQVTVTQWEPIADVFGAFEGAASDMFIEYDPASNLTGYSSTRPTVGEAPSQISGVGFTESATPSQFHTLDASRVSASSATVTVTADKAFNSSDPGRFTTSTVDGLTHQVTTGAGAIGGEWGLRNDETGTVLTVGGSSHAGAYGVPLRAVLDAALPGWHSYDEIVLDVSGSVDGFPGVVPRIEGPVTSTEYTDAVGAETPRYVIVIGYSAPSSAVQVTVSGASAAVRGPGWTSTAYDAYLVWGHPNYGAPGGSLSVSLSLTMTSDASGVYVDPAAGVTPGPQTLTVSQLTTVSVDTISEFSVRLSDFAQVDGYDSLTLSVETDRGDPWGTVTETLAVVGVYASPAQTGTSRTFVSVEVPGHQVLMLYGGVTLSVASGVLTVTGDEDPGGTYALQFSNYSAIYSSALPRYAELTVTYDGRTVGLDRIGDRYGVLFAYESSTVSTTTTTTAETWWSNGYSNSAVSILFARPASATEAAVNLYGEGGTSYSLTVAWRAGDGWVIHGSPLVPSLNPSGYTVERGDWPGIVLEYDRGAIRVYPVSRLGSFVDYDLIDAPAILNQERGVVSPSGPYVPPALGGEPIVAIQYPSLTSPSLTQRVVSTTCWLEGGGLYTQDGVLDSATLFPEAQILRLDLRSFVHVGTGITVSGHTYRADAATQTVTVDRVKVPLSSVSVVWVESGQAPWHQGEESYPSGYSYLLADGRVTQIAPASSLDVRLDGVWAGSTVLSSGKNTTDSHVAWSPDYSLAGFDYSVWALLFLGVVAVGVALVWRLNGGLWDYVTLGIGLIVGFAILEMSL